MDDATRNLEDLPDVPLARAYKVVIARGQEFGGAVRSDVGGGSEQTGGTEQMAADVYNVGPDDLAGFCGGLAVWVMSIPEPALSVEQRIQMAAANALLTGIQFERDRLAAQRRGQR